MVSKNLVRLAKLATKASRKAIRANHEWVTAFEQEFGHTDISDDLVSVIDYGGDESRLTAEFISAHSASCMS